MSVLCMSSDLFQVNNNYQGNEIIISTTVDIRDRDTISITLHGVLNCHGKNLTLPLFSRRQLRAEMSNTQM